MMRTLKRLAVISSALLALACEEEPASPTGTGNFDGQLTTGAAAQVSGVAVYTATTGLTIAMDNEQGFRLIMTRTASRPLPGSYLVNAGAASFEGTMTLTVSGTNYQYLIASGNVELVIVRDGLVTGSVQIQGTPITQGAPYPNISLNVEFQAGCAASCFPR